jgi:CRP-like cAMP-binding protein
MAAQYRYHIKDTTMTDIKNFFSAITSVSVESWDKFAMLFQPRILEKGDYFIRDGHVAKELGFLETGIMRVFYRNDKGVEYNKHFFVNPCLIGGYASLITKQPAQINQQALTDCTLLVAPYSEIQALYATHHDIERAARIIAEYHFVQKEQREIEIVLLDAEKRYRIFQQEFPHLEQHIPQYHIASYLGITPTQLSRIRKKLSTK